jgi:hypothetical protein
VTCFTFNNVRYCALRLRSKPAPLIATWLYGTYHSAIPIAIYIAICAVITLVATAMMSDYTGKDISGEYQTR